MSTQRRSRRNLTIDNADNAGQLQETTESQRANDNNVDAPLDVNVNVRVASSDTTLRSSSSTSTVIDIQEDDLSDENPTRGRRLTIKLDRLHDKVTRYESHKEFLQKCIQQQLIPNGLKIDLEPTIGNHDEEFVCKWYEKLNKFSLELMQDVATFCEQTINSSKEDITQVDADLRNTIHETEYAEVTKIIKSNIEDNTRQLKLKKNRKLYAIRFNKQQSPRQRNNEKAQTSTRNTRRSGLPIHQHNLQLTRTTNL